MLGVSIFLSIRTASDHPAVRTSNQAMAGSAMAVVAQPVMAKARLRSPRSILERWLPLAVAQLAQEVVRLEQPGKAVNCS